MTRPLTIYFISIWFATWLIGIPLHNQDILVMQFGPDLTLLFLIVISIAALVIGYQLLQCHPAYMELVLAILSLQLGYLLTRFIWLTVHQDFVAFPLPSLVILSLNLYCVIYLMMPLTQNRIRRARAEILGKTTSPAPPRAK